ncbi:hypothetical protein JTB14_028233 [Gonioctena quinquepunctata]|nr:hypothetical protein JTB14_028233 [Gonioctena quinquepunctata]
MITGNAAAGKSNAHSEIGSADSPGTSGIVRTPISKHSEKQRANEVSEGEKSDKLSELRAPIYKHSKKQRANEVSKGEESDKLSELESGYFAKSAAEEIQESGLKDIQRAPDEHISVLYDGNPYPEVITEIESEMVKINAMVKSLKWKWNCPQKTDEIWYSWDKILGAINAPKQMTERGFYSVPECDRF